MAQSRTIPSRSYTPGTRTVDLNAIPAESIGGRVQMTRESWPADALITVRVLVSRDNGTTFTQQAGATFVGGDVVKRDGTIATHSALEFEWPGEYQNQTRVALKGTDLRIEFTNSVTITTQVTLSALAS